MPTHRQGFTVETRGGGQTIDVTDRVAQVVIASGIRDGIACVFTPHSTAAIVVNEHERGLIEKDLPAAIDRLVPRASTYVHNQAGDPNGHSHLRAMLLGPSVTFPIGDGRPLLGTWQQVLFLELDTRARTRQVVVQIVGDRPANV
jgi:secondary thiamine-phosphate synthase enzyme